MELTVATGFLWRGTSRHRNPFRRLSSWWRHGRHRVVI